MTVLVGLANRRDDALGLLVDGADLQPRLGALDPAFDAENLGL
jgi:hypothetical protein